MSHRPDDRKEGSFSPDEYLREIAKRQAMRLRLRSKQLRRKPKGPAISLAERIVISKLDPENLSVQATREPALQEAISATPRPTLSELIQEYRRIKEVEKQLGESMLERVHETQDHMKRVEEFVQQPMLMQGDADIRMLDQPDGGHRKIFDPTISQTQRHAEDHTSSGQSKADSSQSSRRQETSQNNHAAASEMSTGSKTKNQIDIQQESFDEKSPVELRHEDAKDNAPIERVTENQTVPSNNIQRSAHRSANVADDRRSTRSPLPDIMMTAAREYRKSAGPKSRQSPATQAGSDAPHVATSPSVHHTLRELTKLSDKLSVSRSLSADPEGDEPTPISSTTGENVTVPETQSVVTGIVLDSNHTMKEDTETQIQTDKTETQPITVPQSVDVETFPSAVRGDTESASDIDTTNQATSAAVMRPRDAVGTQSAAVTQPTAAAQAVYESHAACETQPSTAPRSAEEQSAVSSFSTSTLPENQPEYVKANQNSESDSSSTKKIPEHADISSQSESFDNSAATTGDTNISDSNLDVSGADEILETQATISTTKQIHDKSKAENHKQRLPNEEQANEDVIPNHSASKSLVSCKPRENDTDSTAKPAAAVKTSSATDGKGNQIDSEADNAIVAQTKEHNVRATETQENSPGTDQNSEDAELAISDRSSRQPSTMEDIYNDRVLMNDSAADCEARSSSHNTNLHHPSNGHLDDKHGTGSGGDNIDQIEKPNSRVGSSEEIENVSKFGDRIQLASDADVKSNANSSSPHSAENHPDHTKREEGDYRQSGTNTTDPHNTTPEMSDGHEHNDEKVPPGRTSRDESENLSNPDTTMLQSDCADKAENECRSPTLSNIRELPSKGENCEASGSQEANCREYLRPRSDPEQVDDMKANVSLQKEDYYAEQIVDDIPQGGNFKELDCQSSRESQITSARESRAMETSGLAVLHKTSPGRKKTARNGDENLVLPKLETAQRGNTQHVGKERDKSFVRQTSLVTPPLAKPVASPEKARPGSLSYRHSPSSDLSTASRQSKISLSPGKGSVLACTLSLDSHSKVSSPDVSACDERLVDVAQYDDRSEISDDDRIYDFIGIARERSYTLPEVLAAKHLTTQGLRRQYKLHKQLVDIHTVDHRTIPTPTERTVECFRTPDKFEEASEKLPPIHVHNKTITSTSVVTRDRMLVPGFGEESHLPSARKSISYQTNKKSPQPTDDRQYRILGLYNELKTFNVYCHSQSSVRLAVSQRTTDLNMRIEWGRPLPERDPTFTKKKERLPESNDTSKTKNSKENVKFPPINTKARSKSENDSVKYMPKFRHDSFIFLEDAPFPEVNHPEQDVANRDVSWFMQPGVPTQRCDVGFSASGSRHKTKKEKAWAALRKKCLPKAQILQALERSSLQGVHRLGIQ